MIVERTDDKGLCLYKGFAKILHRTLDSIMSYLPKKNQVDNLCPNPLLATALLNLFPKTYAGTVNAQTTKFIIVIATNTLLGPILAITPFGEGGSSLRERWG
jgi:hypothetical protein